MLEIIYHFFLRSMTFPVSRSTVGWADRMQCKDCVGMTSFIPGFARTGSVLHHYSKCGKLQTDGWIKFPHYSANW